MSGFCHSEFSIRTVTVHLVATNSSDHNEKSKQLAPFIRLVIRLVYLNYKKQQSLINFIATSFY